MTRRPGSFASICALSIVSLALAALPGLLRAETLSFPIHLSRHNVTIEDRGQNFRVSVVDADYENLRDASLPATSSLLPRSCM